MALFSWFIKSTSVDSEESKETSLEQGLSTLNSNTMWPVAKVRDNIIIQQQKYVSATSHIEKATKINVLKEHTH